MNWKYKGTLAELRQVTTELKELRAERSELDVQETVLEHHRRNILQLLAQKAKSPS